MEDPLEQEHSIANDDLKPSSSSTATATSKSSRSTKQTTTNGTTRRHKRRRQTNSTRSSSDHSTSSSRSSSTSSHSSHSSIKNSNSVEPETQKTRSCLAQEQLHTIINKTKTGKFDILDSFSFLTFEADEDWRIAYEHFNQLQLQRTYTNKKSLSLSNKKNGHLTEHSDGNSLQRSISVPCKIEDGHRTSNNSMSNATDDTTIENHRSSMWQNVSPSKNSNDRLSSTIKSEPIDQTNRTLSEHGENRTDNEQSLHSSTSTQKSKDDVKNESSDKKHHHHHHHKSHKRHKTKHDLSINGDSSNKHPTITSMSDLAKQHIKHESLSMAHSLNFPPQFDPKLFSMSPFTPFGPHVPPPTSTPFPAPYDPSLMLASRLYGSQYSRDLLMPPPPPPPARPPSRSLQHPFSIKDHQQDTSMEKMFEKYYPGVLPGYLAAAASAAAAASSNSNSPVSSLNAKMHGNSPNGPDHPLWSHREALQRQYLSTPNKPPSTKSPIFDSNTKLPSNHSSPSPVSHHHGRHSSSSSNPDIPPTTTPSSHPLYLAPVIVTEFHQHQHNHNHTHEHKLNITTKDERQSSSPRSKTPLSNENKKMKTGFSVTDMFIDKPSPGIKHSPQSQGFLSVNKKETTPSPIVQLKKPSNGKWSTAHVHIAWMIFNHEQRQRDKLNLLNQTNKVRPSPTLPSSQPTLLPPPIPLSDTNNDLSLVRPPMPPPHSSSFPFPFPFDINAQQNALLRLPSSTKLPRPTVAPSSTSSSSPSIKPPSIKREQKLPFMDERIRRTSPSPLARSASGSNFLPPSPSHRMKMDFSSLLLPPQQQQQQQPHTLPTFALPDDRKRFVNPTGDLLPPFGSSPSPSPFLSSFFPMAPPPMPPPPMLPSASSSRRSGINSDSPKSLLFPPPPSTPFDFTRSPMLPAGFPQPNNHLEADRYRFLVEQARDRDLQYAMFAAAAAGNGPHPPPPPFFTDPNAAALFKHYSN